MICLNHSLRAESPEQRAESQSPEPRAVWLFALCSGLSADRHRCHPRRAIAAVELALLLPLLMFLFVITVDWARIFYYSLTLANCARQGALYGSDPISAKESPYTSVQQAALADAVNLSPQPTVAFVYGTDGSGNPTISVTVAWQFSTLSSYPGVASPVNLSRTVTMRVATQ